MSRAKGQQDVQPRVTAARKLAGLAAAKGVTPLDVLLETMRRAWARVDEMEAAGAPTEAVAAQMELANTAAVRAAPYVHPRLAAVAVQEMPKSRPDLSALSEGERMMLATLLRRALPAIGLAAASVRVEIEGEAE